jgi:outer membrane receptor protein involved in Fe transport
LRFNLAGGWEATAIAKGESAIDLMDRTAGTAGWYVVKSYINQSSNCIFPTSVAKWIVGQGSGYNLIGQCTEAYILGHDPITSQAYTPYPQITDQFMSVLIPPGTYPGFDPATAPNNGQGFAKNLGGNSLPNAPPWTLSVGAQYSVPLSSDWAGTLRSDLYWQDASWWRVFNDMSYDKLHAYSTVNLSIILTNQAGWQVMLYDKNVFNTTAITGAFLNSDDSGLTTNVFLTDPRLIGIRVTKNW